jgi:hypothetical protein
MSTEAADVHLGSRNRVKDILKDLRRRKSHWLQAASKAMAKAIEKDWKDHERG